MNSPTPKERLADEPGAPTARSAAPTAQRAAPPARPSAQNASELDFVRLFEHRPGAYALLAASDGYEIVAVTPAYCSAGAVRAEDIIGRPLFDVFPENRDDPTADGARRLRVSLDRVRATACADRLSEHRYDVRSPDGAFHRRYWEAVNSPVIGADGTVTCIVHSVEDVTDRMLASRRMTTALDAAQAQMLGVLDAIAEGYVKLDRDYRVLDLNAEALRIDGRPIDALRGRTHWELWPASVGTSVEAAYRRAMTERVAVEIEHRYVGEGHDKWLMLRIYPSPEGVVALYRDITDRKRAQDALRDSEERLRLAVQSSSLGWWDMDPRTGGIVWSANARRMFDFPTDRQVALEAPVDRMHPDDRERVAAAIAAAIAPQSDGSYRQQYRVVWRDATVHWIDAVGRVQFEGEGDARQAVRFAGVLWDITEQQQSMQALRDSEARFRLLADTMPQIVWATRPDGYHDYFNERWYEYTGMPRPDEPGGEYDPHATGQGWNWKDYLHPDDYQRTLDLWSACLATGEPYHVEYRFKRRDGQYRWFIGRALALRDEAGGRHPDGPITRWFGTLTDIDDQKRVAQERDALLGRLRTSEARLRAVIDTVPVGIVIAEAPGGRIIEGNRQAEEIFRHPVHRSTDIAAYREWVSFHPDGRRVEAHEYPLARVLAGGEQRAEMEVLYQRGDGTRGWVRLVGAPIREDGVGKIGGGVVVTLDIDRERRAFEALQEADRRKDEFLAMLAHELRNPLAPVVNAIKVIERRETLTDTGRRAIEMIDRQTRQMKRLIDDLLEVSRITRGKIEIRPEPMLLGAAIQNAVETALPAFEARRQALEAPLPARPIRIAADPVRIAQVLENLLTNASKYTPEGGTVRIEADELHDAVEIRVSDSGIGIASDKLEAVFELFVQAEPGVGAHQGGLGIGLALVRRLVELHGGTVQARSDGPGKGSCFTVRLPRPPLT